MQRVVFLLVAMVWGVFISAQLPLETLERANLAFEEQDYQRAIQSYEEYLELTGNRSMVALKLAQAYYKKGYYGSASEELFFLREQSAPTPPDVYWWEARILHAQNRFDVAAKLYKKYWQYASRSAKKQVEQALLHCETGEKIHAKGQVAFVQNMGHEVNSTADEWAPFPFEYNGSRGLVFSSDRMNKAKSSPKQSRFRPYFLSVHSEQAREISMPPSDKDAVMYHARSNRNEGVLFSGEHWPYGELHSTQLIGESVSSNLEKEFVAPPNAKFGDTDLFFTQEGCILFSAVMEGTKGGYDIYQTCPQGKSWTPPQAVSGLVNGPWHERAPSLHPNGKILFFSSDRPEGLGGFDVFYSVKRGSRWSSPINLGLGVNSLKDELFFKWGKDEYSAHFISDRPESIGGFDIYQAYFKEPIVSEESLLAYAEQMRADEVRELEEVLLKPLFFTTLEEELSSSKTNYLHELSEYLMNQPDLDIQVISRSRYEGPKKYDLLFSLKKANQVADYLNEKGIAAERIHMTGAGSGSLENVKKGEGNYQYRVDFLLSDISEYKEQSSSISSSDMNQLLHESDFFYLAADKLLSGLTYSVQVAALERLYESEVLEEFQWPMVRVRYGRNVNHYTVGLFNSYREAKNLRRRLLASGHKGAFIVANIDGIRKTRGELHPLKHKFKDLTSYIYVD